MMKHLKSLALCIMGAAGGLLLYCGSFYIKSYMENRQEQKKYETIEADCLAAEKGDTDAKKTDAETGGESDGKTNGKKDEETSAEVSENVTEESRAEEIKESFGISWEKLREINPEIVAWITVPGADISYPVVRGEDDDYYLNHSFEREESPFGSIFLGCVNTRDFLDSHSFVYGHNMEGNMMFANLNRYENPEFLSGCPGFTITTPEREFHYDIFSVEQADENGVSFRYGQELGSDEYRELLWILKANSLYETGVEPDVWQRMVTLVTCNSRLDEHVRMAVHGICRER